MGRKAVTPTRIRQLRDAQGWSAYELACKLNCTRSYIKSLEGGSLPITHRFAMRFVALERQTYAEAARHKQIKSLYPLPRELKILARPRRCRICREWFIFPHPQQRVCTDPQCCATARQLRAKRARRSRKVTQ
ncbi:MAG: helix-turn-helix transcriptional regulator [Chloroflexi bacterium]|nr:helix-turn-helix transcriptional regulator [Chloroflexota bacterium]